jgi:UDP-N-acetylmuramoyl-L-alanyl-D-glutamate--2,6-diaminopimelate ligase
VTAERKATELVAVLRREGLLVEAPPPELPDPLTLTTDSREAGPGSAFIAVRGTRDDGHRHLAEAFRRGASLAIVERAEGGGPQLVVADGRRAAIALARWWYREPARRLSLVGVTGTSGKTTTTLLIRHLLNGQGRAGSIGTLGAFDGHGGSVPSTAGSLTTPGPVDLQATLAGLVAAGVDRVAMETSSHSLDQGRLDGLTFDAAVFTNLSREHLDYHPTMDDYRRAKLKLRELLAPGGATIVNADDPAWEALAGGPGVITFGQAGDAQLRVESIALRPTSSQFTVTGRFGSTVVELPLPGAFNVANATAAAAAALGLGLELREIGARLASAPQVPGRMERLTEVPCVVIRDYAHKPDALERVLQTLRPITPGKLICLFGCGGDRDKGKRPIMGRIAGELADLVILASDNPRTEDPERIIEEIAAGIAPGAAVERRTDRREAIRHALGIARSGDTILLAGKGHESYQIVGTRYLPFGERAIVMELVGATD